MAIGIQYQVVGTLSPLFLVDFAVTVADIGLLIGLYHAPGIILAFPGGAVAARLGDTRVVLGGLALMIAGELLMGLTSGWSMQIAGRLLAGSGGILLNVAIAKMVTDWFAGKEIATAMAIFGNASPCGIALALVVLPLIAGPDGRALASFAVAAYIASALFALAFLYRAPPQAAAISQNQSHWPNARVAWSVAAAGVIYGLYNVSLITIIGFGPLMLTERGWSIAAASSTTSIVLWLFVFSLPFGGWIADRTGRNATVLIGGLVAYAMALLLSSRVGDVVLAFTILGVLSGLPCGPILSLPARVLAPETRSIGMGLFFSVYYLMNVLGPWVVGYVAERAGSARIALDLGAACLVMSGLVWIVFWRLAKGTVVGDGPTQSS
jgi:MFS family permease